MKAIEKTAYHEAGHVVCAYFVRLRVRHVTIVPDVEGNYLGCAFQWGSRAPSWEAIDALGVPDNWSHGRTREGLEKTIMQTLAGQAAEALLTRRRPRRRPSLRSGETDTDEATTMASRAAPDPDECGAYVDYLWFRTLRLLRRPHAWAAVQAVAQALLKRQTLSGRELGAVIKNEWAELAKGGAGRVAGAQHHVAGGDQADPAPAGDAGSRGDGQALR